MKKVIVTGPESTGKTTLSRQLATHFKATWLPEYAREYMAQLGRPYAYEDVLNIAREQYKHEMTLVEANEELAFCDTGLLVISIWLEDKFDKTPKWLDETLRETLPALYLLMYPDLPWEVDQLREDPERGHELFEVYRNKLEGLQVPYVVIRGNQKNRFQNAVEAVNECIEKNLPGWERKDPGK